MHVVEQHQNERKEIPGQLRLVLGAIALGLAVLFTMAAILKPSPCQYGTHRQLGLPPCSFLVLFGVRCPTCGMTTAWVCLMHGELTRAFQANAGGVLLAALAAAAVPWLIISAVRGRWLLWNPDGGTVGWTSAAILAVTLVQWGFRLLSR
jgi:hypothetical protein